MFTSGLIEIRCLKDICLNEKIKLANAEITIFNEQINILYNKQFNIDKAFELYNSISETTKNIKEIYPQNLKDIEGLKPILFNRILQENYEKKDFGKAINIITKYNHFTFISNHISKKLVT